MSMLTRSEMASRPDFPMLMADILAGQKSPIAKAEIFKIARKYIHPLRKTLAHRGVDTTCHHLSYCLNSLVQKGIVVKEKGSKQYSISV